MEALLNMLEEHSSIEAYSIEAYSCYLDYVKAWTETTDRGGLQHVSEDTFRFFEALESVTSKTTTNENILFHWELAS